MACTKVCRNKAGDFTARVREISGFDLLTTPRSPFLEVRTLPELVPVMYHKGSRRRLLKQEAVALPLYMLFHKGGTPKHATREQLCSEFALSADTDIVLTGTDQDRPIERWWALGEDGRRRAARHLRRLDVALVTTPNFSLFVNTPRWDDLHSMKRIALIQSEFAQEGVPSALHVNGRTERDFERWAEFLRVRPEISHIAYEFGTGAGRSERIDQHVDWLKGVAAGVGRPLSLVIRSGLDTLSTLAPSFRDTVLLDTTVFMKSIKRQVAFRLGNKDLGWKSSPTPEKSTIDHLFETNLAERAAALNLVLTSEKQPNIKACG